MFSRPKQQSQDGGPGSTNAQAGRDVTIYQGISLSEVQDVVRDAIAANALEMRQVAREVMEERISTFSELFVERAKNAPELVSATADPDVQHVLIDAGLGFARSGDKDMGDVLIDLLTDRAREQPRSLLALVINDAVSVAPRLTDGEFAILTIYWRLVHTISNQLVSLDSLATFLRTDIAPLVPFVPRGEADYLHLQSLGCAVVQITSVMFDVPFIANYRGLFSRGFRPEDIPEKLLGPLDDSALLIPSLRNAERQQIDALNEQVVRNLVVGRAAEPYVEDVVNLMNSTSMQNAEVVEVLAQVDPRLRDLAEIWSSTPMSSLRLSAVGMALAHANWRHLTGAEAPLSTWISVDGPS